MTPATSLLEHVAGTPHPRLRALVRAYTGFREEAAGPVRRRELPFGGVAVIVSLESSWWLEAEDVPRARFGSFAGGLIDRPVLSEHDGLAHALQFDLTPQGARVLLGVPGRELTRRVVSLDDLLGPAACRLADELAHTPGWPARFAVLDAFLLRRLAAGRGLSPEVEWAWGRIVATGGAVPIGELTRELRCSRRHLAARFGEDVGMTPKAYARLLRFERAVDALRTGRDELGAIAAACGFADQAHFTRELRAFAGVTPTALLAERTRAGFLV